MTIEKINDVDGRKTASLPMEAIVNDKKDQAFRRVTLFVYSLNIFMAHQNW